MKILKEFISEDKCSYLENKKQTTYYKIIKDCDALYCQNLIERGYRRFGNMFFRPICNSCIECQSIKIDVKNFTFSKSKRRIINKAKDLKSIIRRPSMTKEHLELFDKYHLYMSDKKDWKFTPVTPQHYFTSFVEGYNEFGYEVLYFDDDKLVGVDIIDILDNGVSSIYFYYDPDYAEYSLGKLSLYQQIKFAKKTNKEWIYLGYYVQECPSLSYKAEYKPYLTLDGRPNEDEDFTYTKPN